MTEIVEPATAEIIDIETADDERLGEFLERLDQDLERLRDLRTIVDRELVARMDRAASWTRHAGPYKLTAPSPRPSEEWSGQELRVALSTFSFDQLDPAALDAAVEVVTDYKVKKAGVNALRALGGEIAATVERLRRERPKGHRPVKLERVRRAT